MNKKEITILICALFMMLSLGACGKVKEDEYTATQQESSMQVGETVDLEINADEDTVNMDSEIKNSFPVSFG